MASYSYLLSAVCHDQFHVQRLRKTTDFQHVEAKNEAVLVHLFHNLIMSRFAEIAFLLLKHDFEEVALAIVPDCYVLLLCHNAMPFLMESVRYAVRLMHRPSSRRASVPHLFCASP